MHFNTETALVKALMAYDSAFILLNLSASCNTIHYNILLHRIENTVVIKGNVPQWFEMYLFDRLHFVNINGESFSTHES